MAERNFVFFKIGYHAHGRYKRCDPRRESEILVHDVSWIRTSPTIQQSDNISERLSKKSQTNWYNGNHWLGSEFQFYLIVESLLWTNNGLYFCSSYILKLRRNNRRKNWEPKRWPTFCKLQVWLCLSALWSVWVMLLWSSSFDFKLFSFVDRNFNIRSK